MGTPYRGDQSSLTFLDLFCGAGGLSLGFEKGGFRCVAAVDNDPAAVTTYRQNLGTVPLCEDICEDMDLPRADAIVGGPPCQGFSSAGMRRAGDRRNSLVGVFARLVARLRPMVFVFENVEGFLTVDGGERVLDLLDPLIGAGYRLHVRKINAANYGVPQHRKRVIAIGGLGMDPLFPEPTRRAFGAPGTAAFLLSLPRCETVAEALHGLPAPANGPPGDPQGHYTRPISLDDMERIRALKPGQTMRDLPERLWHDSYRRRAYRRVMDGTPTERRGGAPFGLRRLRGDHPCKAVTTGAVSEFVHPTEDRFLTLRECARMQTFPDDFIFSGTLAQAVQQAANAVPPRLGSVLAESVRHGLQNAAHADGGEGALLSVVMTSSTGMSPALQRTSELVRRRFGRSAAPREVQLELWP